MITEADIQQFWEKHPCGDHQVGGLEHYSEDYERFFSDYDNTRYAAETHILDCLDRIDFQDRDVLEIGLGEGAESEQIIRRGASWSGLDLTAESIARVRMRLLGRKLPFADLKQGSALSIPYEDKSFDIVFSHGVLHHVPDIVTAQAEIARVLRPNGELIIMLYARWSLNYLLSISLLRRLGLALLVASRSRPQGIYGEHVRRASETGLFNYLKMENFIHRNTDGPANPYSKVYDLDLVERDFPDFRVATAYKRHMHAPPLPVSWLPFQRMLGWHLWVHLIPQSPDTAPPDSENCAKHRSSTITR